MVRDEAKWALYLAHATEWFNMTGEIPRGDEYPGPWVQQQRSALHNGFSWLTPERIEGWTFHCRAGVTRRHVDFASGASAPRHCVPSRARRGRCLGNPATTSPSAALRFG